MLHKAIRPITRCKNRKDSHKKKESKKRIIFRKMKAKKNGKGKKYWE